MLGVGHQFPSFSVTATVSDDISNAFQTIDNSTYQGKWLVLFFWPKDFTFVCPTEIQGFAALNQEFQKRNAQVLGASTDSEFVHLAWRKQELKNVPFPMLSDIKRELTTELGILDPTAGVAQRATYIIDPEGIIRFVMVTDLSVGRNTNEVVRVLDALQSGGLCACNWESGQKMIQVG